MRVSRTGQGTLLWGLVFGLALRPGRWRLTSCEDVTQTVFSDLARKAPPVERGPAWRLAPPAQPFNVAHAHDASRRRRESARKTSCPNGNALQDHSDADLECCAHLDEAHYELEKTTRTANHPALFRKARLPLDSAETLGSNENSARNARELPRLAKLHLILTRRGVTLSAAGAGNRPFRRTLTASPAGLVAVFAGHVLATSTLLVRAHTFLKIMARTKLKTGVFRGRILSRRRDVSGVQTQAPPGLRP